MLQQDVQAKHNWEHSGSTLDVTNLFHYLSHAFQPKTRMQNNENVINYLKCHPLQVSIWHHLVNVIECIQHKLSVQSCFFFFPQHFACHALWATFLATFPSSTARHKTIFFCCKATSSCCNVTTLGSNAHFALSTGHGSMIPFFVPNFVWNPLFSWVKTLIFESVKTNALVRDVMMIQKGNDKMFGEWSNKLQNEDRRFVVNVVCL